MTSTVRVLAHCSDDKEVVIIETDNVDPSINKRTIIQNGDTYETAIYDNRVVTTQEVLKV